jgi:zinc protease
VTALRSQDLREFHRNFTTPDNCVLAIYGDINTEQTKTAIEAALGQWKRSPGGVKINASPETLTIAGVKRIIEARDKKQAVMVVGFIGTTLHDPDRYALELLQESCSDLGSRLFLQIREKMGLAYFVGAQNFVGLAPGYFAFYVGTMPEKVDLVESELLNEAALLREAGLSKEELKRAKAKVIGQKKISRQDLGTLAMTTALDELFGLGYGHIDSEDAEFEAVTLDQVKAIARKYLKADSVVVAVVKPEDFSPNK